MGKTYVVAGVTAALAVPLVAATPASAAQASSTVAPSVRARSYSGSVASVIDGYLIRVRINGRTREVRLIGVATASSQQCYAAQATRYARRQLDGRHMSR